MGINTQALVKNRLVVKGILFYSSILSVIQMRSLKSSLLIVFFALSMSAFGADYYYVYKHNCGTGPLSAADILQYGIDSGVMNSGHANGGVWDDIGGLSFDNAFTNELAVFTNYIVGNTYVLTWNKNNVHYYYITVEIQQANAPVVDDFYANNPTPCVTPYNAQTTIELSGGVGPYEIVIQRPPQADFTGTLGAGSTSIGFGSQTNDKTYTLTTVSDANGCIASGLPLDASFTVNPGVSLVTVSGANACLPSTMQLTIASPQSGITYYLSKDGVKVIGSEISSIPFEWNINQVGSYSVYGIDPCGGADVLMNGGPFILSTPPAAFGVSIVESSPYCTGNPITIQVDNSEDLVNYELLDPSNTVIETIAGSAGNSIQFSTRSYSAAGTYRVRTSSGACTSIYMLNDVAITASPQVFNVSGGPACENSNLIITLSNSQAGVSYSLMYDDGTSVTSVESIVRASAGSFSFSSVNGPGTYWVEAENGSGCSVLMAGTAIVDVLPGVFNMTTITGGGCSNEAHVFGLNSSESDVTYVLYNGASPAVGVPVVNGSLTGGAISFNGVSDQGTYTVYAQRGSCLQLMNGSFVIESAPDVSAITLVGTDGCSNELKNIGISANEVSVTYDLILDGNTTTPVATFVGNGNPGTRYFYSSSVNLPAGVYTVRATALNGCEDYITGSITITNQPTDLPFVGGIVCGTGDISIPNGEVGVTYTLYYDDGSGEIQHPSYAPITPLAVSTVSFNGLNAAGTYRVYASSGGCSTFLTNVLVVEKTPVSQVITIPDDEYCANETGVSINISNTEAGVDYVLIDNVGTDVATITGIGKPRSFTNVTQGIYSIEARSSSGSCSIVLMTNIVIQRNNLPTVDIVNLPGDYCEDQGVVTLIGSPTNAGGVWSGLGLGTFLNDNTNGTADFDPGAVSTPGATYNITYTYTDGNGCVNSITEGATVHANAIDATTLFIVKESDNTAPDTDYCEDSPDVLLKARYNGADITTNDAVFGGPGVTDHGDGTATFSPATAGLGTHSITLNYIDATTNCSGNTGITVDVGVPLNLVNPIAPSYCSSDNTAIRLRGQIDGVDPAPGTTNFDICDDAGNPIAGYAGIPNDSYDFIPATFFAANGAGDYQIHYNYNSGSCTNTLVSNFCLYESVDASFQIDGGSGQTTFCYEKGEVNLEGVKSSLPTGATSWFSGNGVSGTKFFTFDANVVYNPATNPVTYTINNNGCVTSSTRNITVTKVDVSIVDLLSEYCTNQTTQVIKADELDVSIVKATFKAEKNGNLSPFLTQVAGTNTATIDPSVGEGNYVVTMTYEQQGDGCIGIVQQNVTVHLAQPVTFIGVNNGQKICRTSGVIDLIGDMPDIDGDGTPDGQGNFIEIAGVNNTGTDTNGNAIVADDGKAILYPSSMTPGTYTIRYEYLSDPGSCFTYFEKEIEIVDSPSSIHSVTVNGVVGGNSAYCIDDSPLGVKLGLDGANTGVTYELLLAGSSLSPAVTFTATTSGAFNFTDDGTSTGTELYFSTIGVYTVVANVGDCDAVMTGSVSVEQYELILQASNITPVECKGESTGSLTLSASGGSGNYEYKQGVGGTYTATAMFSGLAAGTYEFYVQDISPAGCEIVTPLSVTITEPANDLDVVEDISKKVNVGCTPCTSGGTCEGSATIIITGGTPFTGTDLTTYPTGYNITWPASASNQTTLTATGLAVGTYDVHVEDAEGCTFILPVTISANPALDVYEYDVAANHINNGCYGGFDGAFTVQATGGSGEYQFSNNGTDWFLSNHATDNTLYEFSGLAVGDYTLYVRDLNYQRCEYTNATQVTITQPAAALSLTETANSQVSCNGGSDGSFTVTAAGGNGTYEFSLVNPAVDNTQWQAPTVAPNIFTVSGIAEGNHSVWVRDAAYPSCTNATIVVSVSEAVVLSFDPPVVTNVSCNSGNDGQVILSGAGGSGNYVYQMNDGTTTTAWQVSNTFPGLSADIPYSFSIAESTDFTCNQIDILTVTLSQPSDFVTTEVVVDHKDVSCYGGSDGIFKVTTSGGEGIIEYRLFDGTNYITTWDPNPEFTGLSVGTYQVSVRDLGTASADYCEKTNVLSVVIDQPASGLSFTSEVVTPATCNGSATGEILITVTGGTPPYYYQWTNTDTNTPVSLANGGQSANPTNLVAGNYEVAIIDDNGCPLSNTYVVAENSFINLTIDSYTDVTCYGAADGTLTVSATGGSGTYQYSIDGGTNWVGAPSASYTFTGLDVGLYVVQVEDLAVGGCYAINTVQQSIIQPSQLNLTASVTNVSCNGLGNGSITITASGRSAATDYEYYIGDGAGNGNWQSSPDFTLLSVGDYYCKVRDVLLPTCESALEGPFTVTSPVDFTTTVTVVPVSCNGDSDGQLIFATLPATDIYEYSIDGGTWQTSPVKNLSAGVYTVDVRNTTTGCEKSIADQVITEPANALIVDNITVTHNDCNGDTNGTVEVSVSGGTAPYSYQWRNMSTGIDVPSANNGDQAKAIDLPAGDYRVTVIDNNNCIVVSANTTINQPDALTTTFTVSHISVVGLTDGEIVVANPPTGGTAPYTISWDDGAAFDGEWTRSNLSAGTYAFTIEDAKGCTFSQSVDVLLNQALDFTVIPNTINCYGDEDGILAVTISGGTADYTISWSGTLYDGTTISDSHTTSSTNYEIKPLYAGIYTVTVTDDNGATLSKTNIEISQPGELLINDLIRDDISCYGAGDGRIQVEVTGHAGSDNYQMSWEGPGGYADAGLVSAVSDQDNLVLPGDYTVKVNYNSTCSVSETYTITEPTEIEVTYTEIQLSAAGADDGQILVDVPTGGVSPYTIIWSDGAGAYDGMWTRTGLAPGDYDFIITDASTSNCSITQTTTILDKDALDFTYTVTDINCYSDQEGIIALVIKGGDAPFDLHWDAVLYDGSTAFDDQNDITTNYEIKDLYAGTYQVRITDDLGATISYPVIVAQPNELVISNVVLDDISCAGAADGHIQISLSGHDAADMPNYNLVWTGPGGFSASGAASIASDQPDLILPGTYTVTANYNSTCYVSESYSIIEPTQILVNQAVNQITVAGGSDGEIIVTNPPTGGVAPYSITWDDGAAYDNVWSRTNLSSGTYTYTVTDDINCDVSNTIVIDDADGLDFLLSTSSINCFGANEGIISVIIYGGTGPYDIVWNGTQYDGTVVSDNDTGLPSNYQIENLLAGDYTITITDFEGATLDKTITVGQADELEISLVPSDISCFGAADGRITANVIQGTNDVSSYPIYWTGPGGYAVSGTVGANSTIDNLVYKGIYNVQVTYNGSCVETESYTVNEPDEISISLVSSTDVSCNGETDGRITVAATGGVGFSYQWYIWNDAISSYDILTGETNASINNREAGTYRVVATNNTTSCTADFDHEITEPDALALSVTPTDVKTCNGDDSGELLIEISGGTEPYRYNYGTGNILLPIGVTSVTVSDLYAGTYDVSIIDAKGCTASVPNRPVLEPNPLLLNVTNEFISCDRQVAGWPDGELEVEITGGNIITGNHNYLLSLEADNGSDRVVLATNPGGATHTATFNNLAPDTYTLKVYDQNSVDTDQCVQEYNFELKPITISGNAYDASCEGVADGSIGNIILDGVSSNYSYSWSSPDGGIGLDQSTLNQDGLSFGTYTLSITDSLRGECVVDKDFIIGYDRTIVIDGTTFDVSCFGGTNGAITLDVTGVGATVTYLWTGPGITAANESHKNLTGLLAGDYTVLVTDGACTATRTFTVKQPVSALDFNLRYLITDCDPYVRTIEIFNLTGGSGVQNPVFGDFKYNVSGPGIATQDPADYHKFTVNVGGTYIVKVSDKNNCETSYSITIPEEIVINPVITDVKCNGGNGGAISINLTGGSGSFSYAWTKTGDATYSASTPTINALTAGEYTLVLTDELENDGADCQRTFTFDVLQPLPIQIDATDKGDVTCNGDADGYINLEIQGGVAPYEYTWSPLSAGIVQGNKNQSRLSGGTYTVLVRDANKCTATKNITINEYATISGSITVTDTQCDGTNGSLDLTPSGGSGAYTYYWSTADGNPAQLIPTDQDQSGLTGGTYYVVITDADSDRTSCIDTLNATLTSAIEIVNDVVTPVSCSGNNDGSILFDVIGGDENYTYAWSTADGSASAITPGARNQSGLAPGTYTVTITDGRTSGGTDCSITKDFTIVAATGLNVNVAITHIDCFGESVGALSSVVSGGSGNYSYDWNSGAYTTPSINGVPAGIYTLIVTDEDLGCTFIGAYTIKQPAEPISIDAVNITDVLCYGGTTGDIEIVVSGGTAPYNYIWTGPGNPSGSNPSGLAAGTYSVTIQDDNGCTLNSGDIEITQPSSHITITNPQITDVSTAGGSDGQIQVDVSGGVAPYSFQWFDASNNSIGTANPIAGLSSGTYRVVATDDNGCSFEYTGIRVVQPGENLGFEKTVFNVSPCNGDTNGELHINRVFGGYPIDGSYYRIQVSGPGTSVDVDSTSLHLTGLTAGTYRVTITDDVPVTYQEDITIGENPVLSISTTVSTQINCYNTSTGLIEGSVSGGQPSSSAEYFVEMISDKGYYDSQDVASVPGTFTFNNLPVGNYTILAYDYAGSFDSMSPTRGNCIVSDAKVITQPEASVVLTSADGSNTICEGEDFHMVLTTRGWNFAANGSIRVTLYDGDSYWEENVNQSPYSITVSPSSSRVYTITKVADPSNATCLKGSGSGQVQLTINPLPTANISGPDEMCADGSVDLSVNLTGVSPWSITWVDTNNGTSSTETVTTSPYIFNDTPVADASYSILSVSDANSCSNSGNGQVDVTVNPKPTVLLSGSTNICIGNTAILDIEFGNTAYPYTITYTRNGVNNTMVVSPNSGTTFNWTVSPDESTTYEIINVVDANGCVMDISTTISAVVTVKQLPGRIDTIRNDNVIDGVCQAESGVIYTIDPVTDADGGYIWTAPVGSTIVSGDGTTSVELNFDADFAGGYIKVYATNGCGDGQPAELWIPAKPLPDTVGSITGPTEFCQGSTGITFSVTAVANATHYRWELPTGFIIVGADTASTIKVDLDPMLDVISGSVRVTPYNACGDGPNTASLSVEVYPLPMANAGLDKNICGDTYTLAATDPNSINPNWSGQWEVISGNATISDPTAFNSTLTNISRGDVVLRWTVTNNSTGGLNDCAVYDEVTVRNNTLSISAVADVSNVCNGSTSLSGTFIAGIEGRWEAIYPVGSTASFAPANASSTVVTNMEPGLNRFRWTLTQNGCESYGEVEVTNNEPSEAIINEGNSIAVCDDQVTVSAVAPMVGSGKWTLISGSGLIDTPDSETTLIKGLDYGDNVFRYTVAVNGCEKFDEITVRNNTLQVDAGADQTVCNGSFELDATVPPSNVTGRWIIAEGAGSFDDALSPIATVTDLAQGTNRLIWELNQYGCISTDEIIITNDAPTTATVGSNQVVCAYQTQLSGNAPTIGIGFWSIVTGSGIFDDPSDPLTGVTNLGEGENIFRWTIMHESCSSSADIIIVNNHVVVEAGKDTIVCGRITNLKANTPELGVGEWGVLPGVGGGTIFDNYDPNTQVGGLLNGPNGFIWRVDYNGCISADTVIINNNTPYPVNAGTDQIISGGSTNLNATPVIAGEGKWSLVAGGAVITNDLDPYTSVSNLRRGENLFRWTVTNMGCEESDEVTITNGETIDANAGLDQEVCDDYADLQANDPDVGIGEWSVVSGAGQFEDINNQKTRVTNLGPGENVFRWTIYYTNSNSTDEVTITNNKVTTANAGPNRDICGEEYQLEANIPAIGQAEWMLISGSGTFDDITNPIHSSEVYRKVLMLLNMRYHSMDVVPSIQL